ncbi:MAG: YbaB/EbfC family nucleoid-associated protein [Coriobacteriaceae bacterium]|nr:YbaB/EbfC family nucleoid-associated protein [Coriobacteriaceae bacterium]
MAMNQQAMLKQVKKMQKKMEEIQAATALETVEASAGGGMVVATVSGDLKVRGIKIDPEALDPEDVDMLQDMIVAAVNQGLEDAQELASKRMSAVTGGMNIPGLF